MRLLTESSINDKKKLGQRRPRVKPIWQRKTFVLVILLFLTGGLMGTGWWFWKSGSIVLLSKSLYDDFIIASVKMGFSVSEIFVQGRFETDRRALLQALGLARGSSIFNLDLKQARLDIVGLPWIKSATIERQLPNVIYLSIEERRPLALWQNDGRFELIDVNGRIIPARNVGRFGNLINVVGLEAPLFTSMLFDTLALAPELAIRVKAAIRVGKRRWDIQLDNRVKVLLPEANMTVAWVQLAEFQERYRLLDDDVLSVDLRLKDRIVIKRPLGALQNLKLGISTNLIFPQIIRHNKI